MSPLKRKKLSKIRLELDRLDDSLLKVIKKRSLWKISIKFLLPIKNGSRYQRPNFKKWD